MSSERFCIEALREQFPAPASARAKSTSTTRTTMTTEPTTEPEWARAHRMLMLRMLRSVLRLLIAYVRWQVDHQRSRSDPTYALREAERTVE